MGSARFLPVAALAAGLACLAGGCDGDDPAGIDYHHPDLQVDWAFPDIPETVFVLTEIASGEGWHPIEVFASVLPSGQGSPLEVRLHVVGGTYDPDREPYLEYHWATDHGISAWSLPYNILNFAVLILKLIIKQRS
ncbi:MAG: hypothetical protein R6X35_08095, partial [Candidatus Krumholzibacteriia bacterium]